MNKLSLIVLASAVAGASHAAVVNFNLGTFVNGNNPGTGLTATIEDKGLGLVQLTMSNGLAIDNYVPTWLFNVSPSVGALSYAFLSGQAAKTITRGNDALTGGNQLKAGKFDLEFDFATNMGNLGDARFTKGEKSVYSISGLGLSSASFLSLSANDVGNSGKNANVGNYFTAADVRFGNAKSGSVGALGYTQPVPEPASMAALGLGVLGLLKRRKKA